MCGSIVLLNELYKEGQHPCQVECPMHCSYKVTIASYYIHVHEHIMFIEFIISYYIFTLNKYPFSL